jgi:glycosyltransferase involved in cell wall biosynthesis
MTCISDFTGGSGSIRPLKVLNVAETIKGGIATYLAVLDKGKALLNCEFFYLIPKAQASHIDVVRSYAHGAKRSMGGLLSLAWRTIAMVRRLQPDVVFAHSSFAGIAVCVARPFIARSIRVFYCPHGWAQFRESPSVVNKAVLAIERIISYIPNRTINISDFEHCTVLRRGFSRKCVLVRNTVAEVSLQAKPVDHSGRPIKALFVGRFDRQKGVDILFDAIVELQSRVEQGIEFDIVGASVLESGEVYSPPIAANVRYHGWLSQEDILSFYQGADVLIMPSRWEGFGLCALEAFRAGIAVVANPVGGLRDIITDGHDGYFFNGTSAGLADLLGRLDLQDLQSKGAAGRTTYEQRFHPRDFYLSYYKLFHLDASDVCATQDHG